MKYPALLHHGVTVFGHWRHQDPVTIELCHDGEEFGDSGTYAARVLPSGDVQVVCLQDGWEQDMTRDAARSFCSDLRLSPIAQATRARQSLALNAERGWVWLALTVPQVDEP